MVHQRGRTHWPGLPLVHALFSDKVLMRMRAVQGAPQDQIRCDPTGGGLLARHHYGTPGLRVVKSILEKGLNQQALLEALDALK